MAYPMGESNLPALRVDFDRRLKLEFHGSDISSDAGLLPYRELDDALGLTELGGVVLSETRHGKNIRHLLVGLCIIVLRSCSADLLFPGVVKWVPLSVRTV